MVAPPGFHTQGLTVLSASPNGVQANASTVYLDY